MVTVEYIQSYKFFCMYIIIRINLLKQTEKNSPILDGNVYMAHGTKFKDSIIVGNLGDWFIL